MWFVLLNFKAGALAGAFCGALNGAGSIALPLRRVLQDQGVMLDGVITQLVQRLSLEPLTI